jgi:CRP/FNR family transcriptional regulator
MDAQKLLALGGTIEKFDKADMIFSEGEEARYIYLIVSGQVKLFNMNDQGREFTQGIFKSGETFGEPPMLIEEKYPASAMACKESQILRLPKEALMRLLDEDREFEREFLLLLARRLYNKAITAKAIVNHTPQERIVAFLEHCKRRANPETGRVHINHTRQEIANLTGLRVETVIRTLSAMQKNKVVEIINRKLYY